MDNNNSGAFDIHKLQAALKASKVPFTLESIQEMVDLMDFKGSSVVSWHEFHTYISYEVGRVELKGVKQQQFNFPSFCSVARFSCWWPSYL